MLRLQQNARVAAPVSHENFFGGKRERQPLILKRVRPLVVAANSWNKEYIGTTYNDTSMCERRGCLQPALLNCSFRSFILTAPLDRYVLNWLVLIVLHFCCSPRLFIWTTNNNSNRLAAARARQAATNTSRAGAGGTAVAVAAALATATLVLAMAVAKPRRTAQIFPLTREALLTTGRSGRRRRWRVRRRVPSMMSRCQEQ